MSVSESLSNLFEEENKVVLFYDNTGRLPPASKQTGPKTMPRRTFLRGAAAIAAGTLLAACKPAKPTKYETYEQVTFNIDVELSEKLGEEGVKQLKATAERYIDEFGCPISNIRFSYKDFSDQTLQLPGGDEENVIERAIPGQIMYDNKQLYNSLLPTEIDLKLVSDTTFHAMTHACQPLEYDKLDEIIFLPNGDAIYAFQGASLLVQKVNGERTAFRLIEEGIAEALAAMTISNYQTTNPKYHRLGSLTIAIINTYSSKQEFSRLVQTNDFNGIVKIITQKENPTEQDLIQVVNWYNHLAKGEDIETIKKEIVNYANS